uniref:SSD domain-containing protein n=1 Tax=Triparma pacifica TaxID=91992 RepID=A0A7S2QV85_9STRA|mmetsp:Transcript_1671/g.3082  ORF Transcript_1671/g.3082 Transcript_1671/m.3082 type:complete len:996 (+) Transcript_1671:70-3057(+)
MSQEMIAYTQAPKKEVELGAEADPPFEVVDQSFIGIWSKKYSTTITSGICKWFCISLWLLLLLMFASFTLWGNTVPGEYDWTVSSSDYSKEQDAITDAMSSTDGLNGTSVAGNRTTKSIMHSMFYIYEHENNALVETIATSENIQTFCEIESKLVSLEEYPKFCALKPDSTNCSNIDLSYPLLYYGSSHDWSCPLLDQADIDSKTTTMIDALDTEVGELQYGFFFDKDVKTNGFPSKVRSMVQLGAPLEGYDSEKDNIAEQARKYEDFIGTWEDVMLPYIGVESTFTTSAFGQPHVKNGIEVRYWGFDLQNREFMRVVQFDMFFAIFSLIFVYIWIFVHIGSFFLASISMLQIVASLPIGSAIYKGVFQIPFFDTLHVLVLFLVLGVGADDCFVLVDGWKQTAELISRTKEQTYEEYLCKRMTLAYSRTAQAVFNTSFTTAMAFVATAISPIMPISTFGIYAALCIVINYVMVITLTPCAVLVYEAHVQKWMGCFCCPCSEKRKTEEEIQNPPTELEHDRSGIVEKFFDKVYIPMFAGNEKEGASSNKGVAVVSILICVAWGIAAGSMAFQLTPPTEQEKWFKGSHMFTGILDDNQKLFLGGVDDQYVEMIFAYGIEGIDRDKNPSGEKFNVYKPNENRGSVVFDSDFDITNAQTQIDILNGCQLLEDRVCNAKACSGGKLVRPGGVTCFLEEFDTWLTDEYSETRSILDSTTMTTRLLKFRDSTKPIEDPIAGSWKEIIGVVDGEIKFVTIPVVSSMQTLKPVDQKEEVREVVDALLLEMNTGNEATGEVITEAGIAWTWMITERGLVDGLFTGFAICFPVAFGVLMVATKNVAVSIYAIAAIIQIVASVMGIVQSIGYDLGVAESIAGIIVIGFSVDYVVHLAHMYMEGLEEGKVTRVDRFRYACRNMGSTVVAGAITTGGSGSFMFICQLTFFFKMALLIVLTILFSLFYALFFFMPMLLLIGPDTTFCNLNTLFGGKVSNVEDNAAGNKKA